MRQRFGLFYSAAIDVIGYAISPQRHLSPTSRFDCTVYSKDLGVSFQIRGGTDDIYSVLPYRECDAQDAILGSLRSGDTFIDVGANVGFYSVLAAKLVGPSGRVVAIEAVPNTAGQLEKNLSLNGLNNVHIVRRAVASTAGDKAVFLVRNGMWGMASCVQNEVYPGVAGASVETTTIDDVCDLLPHIRLIKLDIEGSEWLALQGALKVLAKSDFIVAECDQHMRDIVRFLHDRHFSVRRLRFCNYIIGENKRTPKRLDDHPVRLGLTRSELTPIPPVKALQL